MKWLTAFAGLAAFAASALATVPPDLTGPEWMVTAIDGVALTGERPPAVLFTRDAVPGDKGAAISGYSGCNRSFGTYFLAPGGKIDIQIRGTTKMACVGPRMELERRILAALDAMAFVEWRYDRTMTMASEDGKTRLDFRQAANP
jgi:heat shock protein HslJ